MKLNYIRCGASHLFFSNSAAKIHQLKQLDKMTDVAESSTALKSIITRVSSKTITEQRQKVCCKTTLSYQMRRIKHKGAILTIIWSFLAISVFHYFSKIQFHYQVVGGGIALLFAGCMAS